MRTFCTNKLNKTGFTTVVAAIVLFFSMTGYAHAYVDPGSGSVIVTTVLGFLAAFGYTFRKTFYNLKRKLRGEGKVESDESKTSE